MSDSDKIYYFQFIFAVILSIAFTPWFLLILGVKHRDEDYPVTLTNADKIAQLDKAIAGNLEQLDELNEKLRKTKDFLKKFEIPKNSQ